MSSYLAEVVSETLHIEANSAEEAEAKYSAFFDGADCPEHFGVYVGECCVSHSDSDVYHNLEETK